MSKQEALEAQIAALQSQLQREKELEARKRKSEAHVLVPASPSPKKRKLSQASNPRQPVKPMLSMKDIARLQLPPADASKSDLRRARRASPEPGIMSHAFAALHEPEAEEEEEPPAKAGASSFGKHRNEDLTLQESLEIGPLVHEARSSDPLFNKVEPYSRINLKSRSSPHEDLQEFMRGRYYVSPSKLYSIVRLSADRQSYEVPIEAEWITIAVVAERGQICVSRGGGAAADEEDSEEESPENKDLQSPRKNSAKKKKEKTQKEQPQRKKAKKYLSLKLVDFGHRSADLQTGKITIKGDALLTMLLFESDGYSAHPSAGVGASSGERVYRGGSGGAFEAGSARLRPGTVIAINSPRVLKPYSRATNGPTPHPTSNLLAVTPSSAADLLILGESKDLGQCPSLKRDGKPCGSWCDKRVSDVCEYHVERAVTRARSGRGEFAVGTSGMSASVIRPSSKYDPSKKWGLQSKDGRSESGTRASVSQGGGVTYVLPSGQALNATRDSDTNSRPVGEVMGRERGRKTEKKKQEKEIELLLDRDPHNDNSEYVGRAVKLAREALKAKKSPGTENQPTKHSLDDSAKDTKRVFSAGAIQRIGFDPTKRIGLGQAKARAPANEKMVSILAELTAPLGLSGAPKLGRRPGPKIRSGVVLPPATSSLTETADSAENSDLEII